MSKPVRVPLWIRECVSRSTKYEPLRTIGGAVYTLIATVCAYLLLRFKGVESVCLRGKKMWAFDPGISDLDFWLFVPETVLNDVDFLLALREYYRKIQRRFLLPGKIEVASIETWNTYKSASPAAYCEDIPLHEWSGNTWRTKETSFPSTIRTMSCFNLGLYNYSQAISTLCSNPTGTVNYYQAAVFKKYISKAFRATGVAVLPDWNQSKEKILAETFLALHSLAKSALRDDKNILTPKLVISPSHQPLRTINSDYLQWIDEGLIASLKMHSVFARRLTQGRYLQWNEENTEKKRTTELFVLLLEYFSKIPETQKRKFPQLSLPIPLSPEMTHCVWRGPLLGMLLEDLPEMLLSSTKRSEEMGIILTDIVWYLFDRLVTRLTHNVGVITSYPSEAFLAPLLYQCFESLALHSNLITNDKHLLCEKASPELRLTKQWFLRLLDNEVPACQAEWSKAFLEVRKESLLSIKTIQNRLDALV